MRRLSVELHLTCAKTTKLHAADMTERCPRSTLASGSIGLAGRGSDHKRYSVAARSSIKSRGLRRHVGAVPCGPDYARYPQAGRDDSRFPRKGEIWPTR